MRGSKRRKPGFKVVAITFAPANGAEGLSKLRQAVKLLLSANGERDTDDVPDDHHIVDSDERGKKRMHP
jgi:hypothetical protein